MGRPEPCVLFAQTILHSQLDEYVDEVTFSEPVVITACEFLEQNASPSTPNVSLVGATSPPSFALEVFVHCEGESRFRRLCQPFLYSHSSSNVLEVEAIVTSHLVLRGTYRSLTLVIYGNTAEDLGQFNIELDLDNSLANVVYSPSEGKLEDLPPALHSSSKFTLDEPFPRLKSLTLQFPESEMSTEVKRFFRRALRACKDCNWVNFDFSVLSSVISSLSSFAMLNINILRGTLSLGSEKSVHSLAEAEGQLSQIWKEFGLVELDMESDLSMMEPVGMFSHCFPFFRSDFLADHLLLSEDKSLTLSLGLLLLLCCSKEGCYHFISNGGMDKIVQLLSLEMQESTLFTLLLVSIVECATRHDIGCEAFLGWWPRGGETIPARASQGYTLLLKLLFEKQRHDIASMATIVLHRLRFYETLSRYESAVVSVLADDYNSITADEVDSFVAISSQLSQLSKLLNMCGPIEDPSPVGLAKKMLNSGSSDGLLSSKATINSITNSKYSFTRFDIDKILLSLLKERGFLPLSAALLSSRILRSATAGGPVADLFMESATSLELILLPLLLSRSGLTFLLDQAEATELVIFALKDVEDSNKAECMTLRQAFVLLSNGFFCHPQDVATITELHIRVASLVDRLLVVTPSSDELLWLLWELCAISRSDTGRQALLAIVYFSEAVSILLDALHSYKDQDQSPTNGSSSSLSLAIFHAAAEIFEVLVTDSTAWSLHSWIGIAVDLHKALHMSSPGSNRKDAPTRLLEWIDAGVVYHRNGAIGLLRYAAVLASGGDAHLSSGSVLVSDSIDAEMVVSDPTIDSDGHIIDNLLGKLVSDKFFEGSDLSSTSITQLTTAFRILAFISEDPAIAATLFEEGAITLIYVVLVHCKYMLERLSNSYDYLVDEGAELSSTADLLLDRSHEQELIDLMVPSLLLLIHVLGKLQETKEVYRNKKLLKALLQLHREISTKLAACAADLSFPNSALGLGAVCHLITSAVAFWPVFGWAPNLFHRLLENVTAKLPVGPKDASSMLSLLGDLLPEEGIWQWKSEIPPLSAVRNLSIGSILGPLGEKEVNWYMQPNYLNQLLAQLTPQLESISLVVLNFSTSGLMVMQDMLRVFIVRLSCQRMEGATVLLDPIFSWLNNIANQTTLSDMEAFKMYQLLHFLSGLLEHPKAKELFCKTGAVRTLSGILDRCKSHSTSITPFSWRIPLLKSFALMSSSQPPDDLMQLNEHKDDDCVSMDDYSLLLSHLSNLFQELPVGKEMLACALTFKDVVLSVQGRSALALILLHTQSTSQQEQETNYWQQSPPLLRCFEKLSRSHDLTESQPDIVVEIIYALSLGTISLLFVNESLEGITMVRLLFGLPSNLDPGSESYKEKLSPILKLRKTLDLKITEDYSSTATIGKSISHQAKAALRYISNILTTSDADLDFIDLKEELEPPSDIVRSVVMTAQLMPSTSNSGQSITNQPSLYFSNAWKSISNAVKEEEEYLYLGFMEKFVWELPQTAQSARRRLASGGEPPAKRLREGSEPVSSFSRGTSLANAPTPSGPSRRDTFRQRKPNTSRPPSMHVDDYVARERNIDGTSIGSNAVASTQRGRPPSIHVDEFIARQKQNSAVIAVAPSTPADAPQIKGSSPVVSKNNNSGDTDKADKPRQAKADIFDEQEIDIDIDEESGSDDKGLFPPSDDNLQPPPVVTGENSPDSVENETLRSPLIRPEKEISSAHNPLERHETKVASSPVTRPPIGQQPPAGPLPGRSGPPPTSNQPPLPPMPPPASAISGQGLDQMQNNLMPFGPLRGLAPPIPGGFPLQPSDVNIPNALMGLQFQQENILQANAMLSSEANKFPWNFNSGGIPMRPMPPLPSQPYSNPLTHLQQAPGNDPSLANIPASHPFAPLVMNRPMQVGPSSAMPQQRAPPPPPPSVPHPSQTVQQRSLGFAQVPLGFPQQLPFPQLQQLYYQNQQMGARPLAPVMDHVDPVQVQLPTSQTNQAGQTSSSSQQQQQQDSAAALQQYFSSPEAIQSLLSDRDKLCQLLETHPKLMQMLQEKLGQL